MSKAFAAAKVLWCLILVLSTLELCARLDDYLSDGAPFIGAYGYEAMLTSDANGVVGRPYGHYLKWKLNRNGYRGPDILWDRERIMCVGSSETFGFTESEGMEYPRQLERELNRRVGYERYQVVNVAYAGQSLGSFARRVDQSVMTVKPRIALIYPSSSAYFDVPIGDSGEVAFAEPSHGFESRLKGKTFNLLNTMPEWAETLRNRFHIWRAIRRTGTIARVPDSNIAYFRRDLDLVLDRLEQDHVRPILITHATRFGKQLNPEDRPVLIAWRRFTPRLQDSGFLDFENRFNDVIRSEAASRHLVLIDAADELSGPEDFADFAHFTDSGAHRMATLIADTLLKVDGAGSEPAGSRSVVSAFMRTQSVVSR